MGLSKNMINDSRITTILSKEEVTKLKTLLLQYFSDNDCITNRKLRELSGITYDQAIYFFGQMIKQNIVNRLGTTSSTHYTLNESLLKKQNER
jgi:predicted HTH transcriptional regulator